MADIEVRSEDEENNVTKAELSSFAETPKKRAKKEAPLKPRKPRAPPKKKPDSCTEEAKPTRPVQLFKITFA